MNRLNIIIAMAGLFLSVGCAELLRRKTPLV